MLAVPGADTNGLTSRIRSRICLMVLLSPAVLPIHRQRENMNDHKGGKNAMAYFCRDDVAGHFLKKRDIREMIILMIIIVVIGK